MSAGNAFVTGASGFIGQNLVKRLKSAGWNVTGYDSAYGGNICDTLRLQECIENAKPDVVFHLAAYANVRRGASEPARAFETNTRGTFNTLEAMRESGCRRVVFTSSCSVYGEPTQFPTTEDAPFPVQTSLYGASKVAGEALVQAYEATYGFKGTILRLASLLGEGMIRGHIVDLHRKLKIDPTKLDVMGNGDQRRSYLYIADCIDAFMLTLDTPGVFNVAGDAWTVKQSVAELCRLLNVSPDVHYEGQERGWVGDSPHIEPSTERLRGLGWRQTISTREAVCRTIAWLEKQS